VTVCSKTQTITELALEKADRGVFPREQAALWVESSGARLDGLLKRAVASDEVWRIHRGLYCLSHRYTKGKVNPLELGQLIRGPSYVSLETALSHHGWIPEGVYAITNVSLERSRSFDTPIGLFTFTRVPQREFLAGVRRVRPDGGGAYFLATPLKALSDLVYAQRRDWTSAASVVESLRVDEREFESLTADLFEEVMSAYGSGRVRRFLGGLREDLKL
jgi:hypothetical protein